MSPGVRQTSVDLVFAIVRQLQIASRTKSSKTPTHLLLFDPGAVTSALTENRAPGRQAPDPQHTMGHTCTGVLQWLRSTATPLTIGATSNSASSVTHLFILRSSDKGCPMPPAAPKTATFLHCTTGMTLAAVLGRTLLVEERPAFTQTGFRSAIFSLQPSSRQF